MQNQINSLIQQAFTYIQNKNFAASKQLLKNVLQLKPNDFNAHNLLSVIYTEEGKTKECIEHLKKALKIEPNNGIANYNMANALMLDNRHSQALPFHSKAAQLNPNDYWVNTNYGISLFKLNQLKQAEFFFQKATALSPEIPNGWVNLANCHKGLKQYMSALSFYEKALAIDSQYLDALFNKSILLFELQQYNDSLLSYNRVINLKSSHHESWSNAGSVLIALKRYDEALFYFDKAIELAPAQIENLTNKGNLLHELKRYDEALIFYNKAIERDPNAYILHSNKGNTLHELKRYDEALSSYETALSIKNDLAFLLGNYIRTKMVIAQWDRLSEDLKVLNTRISKGDKVISAFDFLAISDSPKLALQVSKIWNNHKYHFNDSLRPIPKTTHKKIRLAYFSADFNQHHPVAHLTAELFELHARDQFELYAFSLQAAAPNDKMRERIVNAFDFFLDVEKLPDTEIANLARSLEIDIAIDLGGHTKDTGAGIFYHKAAPIQVNYLGYPGTMGTSLIDYIIADNVLIPREHQQYYSEKIAYLPNSYMVNDSKKEVSPNIFTKAEFGLPDNKVIYCCFNNSYKFNRKMIESWSKILSAVQNSVLWISESNSIFSNHLLREFKKFHINNDRIIFARRLDAHAEHLARYKLADLFLDTQPYGAHTTAIEAIGSGVPVLTLLGSAFQGRVAASLLTAIDCPELIAHSVTEYESIAIKLGANLNALQDIKAKLAANKLCAPLFDTQLFTDHIELLYAQMYQRYQAELTPDHLALI